MIDCKNRNILIATGGTGGHVFPAYSIAKYFMNNKYSVNIVTDKRGYKFLKDYKDIDIKIISSATIFKKNPFNIFIALFKIFLAFISSLIFLIKTKPKIVFGMGGYASFPTCIASKFLGIPFIIYENNLILGKANRYLLPFAYKMFVSYKELEGVDKKYKKKIAEIGNIIREEILNYSHKNLFLDKKTISILVLGGSQAAKMFAEKLPNIFKKCIDEKIDLVIYQQCLHEQEKKLEQDYKLHNLNFKLFNFTHNILNYFSKADLVITRSGASMLAELLNCNIPIISVPLPSSADNHQLKNAKYFMKMGYSFLIEEQELEEKLFPLIKSIYMDKDLISRMKEKQNSHSDHMVFNKIKNELRELIDEQH
jgi:UDP-N-acetylglucosamine--N-acetylmuramyl-(pentapeptide) pyrophosphoryl-undecaprenol N-acetylglucosamine transferase|tara:strand:+ start:803 stop:1903 length:1101 start_codon:yes stop_codon:yes gene_type:complete